jgi:endonuclease/exonuclease/phosphatase family metal-dependent hydrolase
MSKRRTRLLTIGAVLLIAAGCAAPAGAQEPITVTTWNIEHLGSSGRGFGGGFGAGALAARNNEQLKEIAELIRDELGSEILALQEIAITRIENGRSRSDQLDTISNELGGDWSYFLPAAAAVPDDDENMFCAFLWNGDRVNALNIFPLGLPNHDLAGGLLFARQPLVGYFEAIRDGVGTNDFVLINVHLKSGQDNDENHLIAMTLIEHSLTDVLEDRLIKESDRIVLGDFNDNPYATTPAGNPKYSSALYQHMAFKKYVDLVTVETGATRMDENLTSIIDHVLVSVSARQHVPVDRVRKFMPGNGDSSLFPDWRATFSDHFPLSFDITVATTDDDVDFE